MGHGHHPERGYRNLQKRLDRSLTGAPDSPELMRILELLFSPEDAELGARLPGNPTPVDALSRRLDIPPDELDDRMTELARKGLVVDMRHKGRRYVFLAPVVIGFFEFTFMRTRGELPMVELAKLFDDYMRLDDRFARRVFAGSTQLGRTLVHEEALPRTDSTEILDWERATSVIGKASSVGVSLCPCRHKTSLLGKGCGAPLKACLSLDHAAESMIRSGLAERLSTREAMKILEASKEAGLAQTGDNVQRHMSFICNCCGCCCGFMEAVKTFDMPHAIVTSNWIMETDPDRCGGCGNCAEACPVGAVAIEETPEGDRSRVDEGLCLGCGVCRPACEFAAISMRPREKRVFTPETVFDQLVTMAVERGRLAELLFDDPERLSHRALGRVLGVIEKSPPFKAALAVRPLRSVFLSALVKGARKNAGELGEMFS